MSNEEVLFQRIGKVLPAGTVIFKEGETGREMYVIQSGKVNISKKIRDVEKVLATLVAGDFFGEMSILNNKPRSAAAIVLEEAKVLVVEPKMFESMIRNNVEIAIRIIKMLAKRLQEADDQIENLLLKDANSRVVHTLARLAETQGSKVEGGIKLSVTSADLAARTSLKENQVGEVLDKLVKAKLAAISPDSIIVGEVEKLRKFLEFLAMKEQFGDF